MNKAAKSLVAITIEVIAVAMVLVAYATWQIYNYEQGVAELYAQEQDGYVEIVARQINLYGDIAGDEFVEETIEMLDTTSQRYWTLDNTEYFLFVKSISETNVYKTFSTDTFYNTQSAQDFLAVLRKGEVKHSIITLDGVKYVASGIIFEYSGTQYRLCLLTDYEVMLTNNAYLSSKLYLLIVLFLLIALLAIVIIYFAGRLLKAKRKVEKIGEDNAELNKYIDYLDDVIMGRTHGSIVTGEGKILRLLRQIDERQLYPCAFIRVRVDVGNMMNFFNINSKLLDEDVVWIRYCKDGYMLLFGGLRSEDAMKILERRLKKDMITEDIIGYTADRYMTASEAYKALSKVGEDK